MNSIAYGKSEMQLYNDDCISVLKTIPDKSVDLIITDPPYELDNHGGGTTELATRDLVCNTQEYVGFMSSGFDYDVIFSELLRICKIPNMFIFCSNKQISKIMGWFEYRKLTATLLVWAKTNPSPLCNGKHVSDLEFIIYVHGKGSTFNNNVPFEYKKKLYQSPVVSKKDRIHTAQKPVELIKQYIELASNSGDTILDCFMGSGSTALACLETDRNFIGIEIDQNYYNSAISRINDSIEKLSSDSVRRKLF